MLARRAIRLTALAVMGLALVAVGVPDARSLPTDGATLTVQVLTVGGSVSGPQGLSCPFFTCTVDLTSWFDVTNAPAGVAASPDAGHVFLGWGGACSGTSPTCTLQPYSGAKLVTARFAQLPLGPQHLVSVSHAGGGLGSVSGNGIACPDDCTETVPQGTTVSLTASPGAGSVFGGWSGACSGSAPTCTLVMDTAKSVGAKFTSMLSPGTPPNPPQDGTPPPSGGGTPGPAGGGGNPGPPAPTPPGASGTPSPGGPPNPPPTSPETPACTITGTPGSEVLVGTPGNDVICGLGGNDRLAGRGGHDILLGGAGADRLLGGSGNDVLLGGAGRDRLDGAAGKDALAGAAGDDVLKGGLGTDRFAGGTGHDLLLARDARRDRLDGGRGHDRARIDASDLETRIESLV